MGTPRKPSKSGRKPAGSLWPQPAQIFSSLALGGLFWLAFESLWFGGACGIICLIWFTALNLRRVAAQPAPIRPRRPARKGRRRKRKGRRPTRQPKVDFLRAGDQFGAIRGLRETQKTVLLDGNNILHLGMDNRVGATALELVISLMRQQPQQIVCFFDANIYYRLRENGVIDPKARFSVSLLEQVFDLRCHEIYVVPSGTDADKYIIETLQRLRNARIVTNDRYRDYHALYPRLRDQQHWRKGVSIKGNRMFVQGHKAPLVLTRTGARAAS